MLLDFNIPGILHEVINRASERPCIMWIKDE